MTRPRVLLLSPFAGDTYRNIMYAKECLKHSIDQGEAPFASHLLYPQVLIDKNLEERLIGFECEWSWALTAERAVAYVDLGWSGGMQTTQAQWTRSGRPAIEVRRLGGAWEQINANNPNR